MKKKRQEGFTMVELVVVIAIMGVLMAILVPSFLGTIENMKVNSDIRSVQTIQKQAEMYKLQNGIYPGFSEEGVWSESQFVTDLKNSQFIDEGCIKGDNAIMLQSGVSLKVSDEEVLQLTSSDVAIQEILLNLAKKEENSKWIEGVKQEEKDTEVEGSETQE